MTPPPPPAPPAPPAGPGIDHPPGTGQAADPLDWAAWWLDALDALAATIEAADIEWAEDPDGNPYVIAGQRRPAGIGHPHAMILRFESVRQREDSTRTDEHHEIEAELAVFDRVDSRDYRGNLRVMLEQVGAVASALYADRSLGETCRNLSIERATPMEMETDRGDETVGDVQIRITKTATHPY